MFSIDALSEAARIGAPIDQAGLVAHLKSFRHVIIWGAGNLGTAIGKRLLELAVPITAYWDMRADELAPLHGVRVVQPFSMTAERSQVLVVFCITNSFVSDHALKLLADQGFHRVLRGDVLYQGLVCPISEYDGFRACRDSISCDAFSCARSDTLFRRHIARGLADPADALIFRNVTFIINQKCTLRCKYCYSYANSYPRERRVNFESDRVTRDVDAFFAAVDGVKFIPLIGGETFLYPALSSVVRAFLAQTNFGLLNVTTNGICHIPPRALEMLQSERVQIVFSNYKSSLPQKQRDLFDRNVELVRASGAQVIVMNQPPQWAVPTTLTNKHFSLEVMRQKRAACANPFCCQYVKNGRFFPCTITDSIHSIGVAEYPEDFVVIDDALPTPELRRRIRALLERDHYLSCGHCDGVCGQLGVVDRAGEQGYHDFLHDP
jgi:organic radical activating enzyme